MVATCSIPQTVDMSKHLEHSAPAFEPVDKPIIKPAPYQTRPVRFLQRAIVEGWRLKVYGIATNGSSVRSALVDAALASCAAVLPRPPVEQGRYGIGFLVVHDAADRCFVLVDWWSGENEIHQRMLSSPLDAPEALSLHRSDAIGCIWELSVVDFERRAWIEYVLDNAEPDLDGYLSRTFDADV
jgi:hypothetical protein